MSESALHRVYEDHPKLRRGYEKWCPTCLGQKTYHFAGEQVSCDCQLQVQLAKHYHHANIGDTYQRLDWRDLQDTELREALQGYVSLHDRYVASGIGLFMWGPFGSGKTMSSTLVLKDMIKLGYSCYSTTFSGMISTFTAGWKDRDQQRMFEDRIKRCDVLLLDDVGKEMRTKTNLSESVFDDVLRSRVQANRPTFITTNETLEGISEGYGAAILSLLKEKSVVQEFSEDDFREKASSLRLEEIAEGNTRPIF